MTDNQEIVSYFCEKFKIKANGKYGMFLGLCKTMLKRYTKEEIIDAINYLHLHQPKQGVYSFCFLVYVIDDYVAKAKAYKKSIEKVKYEEMKPDVQEVKVENTFANKRGIKF